MNDPQELQPVRRHAQRSISIGNPSQNFNQPAILELRSDACRSKESASPTDDAIRLARQSIDRWKNGRPDECSAELSEDDCRPELDVLIVLLQIIGTGSEERGCSTAAATSESPLRLGRFEILRELGRGGFGVVLEAFDPVLQREVALKIPLPEKLIAGQLPYDFIHEARTVARLDHPGIVRVYEVDRLGPVWYIASALYQGSTLACWLEEVPMPSPGTVARLLVQVADALHYAHSRGVLHLDLKPENLLLEPSDSSSDVPRVVVTDFGLASFSDGTPEDRQLLGGTISYMAPEQRAGDASRIGVAADIYALGAILSEMLSGRRRFDADAVTAAERNGCSPSLPPLPSTPPADLTAICQKCLADDPAHRYLSARELAADLRHYLCGECVAARPIHWPTRLARWARRRPAIAALLAMLVSTALLSMGMITYLWREAETHLADLRAEEQARMKVSERMQSTLLRLTSLTQEVSLQPRFASSASDATTELMREFYPRLRDWSCLEEPEEAKTSALVAAGHSLALIDGLSTLDHPQLEAEFLEGVTTWQQVIQSDREQPEWRQALALHLLTYTHRARHGDWLWCYNEDAIPIDSEVIELVREPYANLLLHLGGRHLAENSALEASNLLRSALELFERRAPNEAFRQAQLSARLIAYNQLARSEQKLGRIPQFQEALEAAENLAAHLQDSCELDERTAVALADVYRIRARKLQHEGKLTEAMEIVRTGAELLQRTLATAPQNAELRLALVHDLQRLSRIFVALSQFDLAEAELCEAIRVLDEGLQYPSGSRTQLRHRAILLAILARHWESAGGNSRLQPVLKQAVDDFSKASLTKQDPRNCWLHYIHCLQVLGQVYANQGQAEEAIRSHRQALEVLEKFKPRTKKHSHYVKISEQAIAEIQASWFRNCQRVWKRTFESFFTKRTDCKVWGTQETALIKRLISSGSRVQLPKLGEVT